MKAWRNKKLEYARKHWLCFTTLTVVIDQLTDIAVFVTLFVLKQYWFAGLYLSVDLLPAMVFMLHKYKTEKSWKVLVSILVTNSN